MIIVALLTAGLMPALRTYPESLSAHHYDHIGPELKHAPRVVLLRVSSTKHMQCLKVHLSSASSGTPYWTDRCAQSLKVLMVLLVMLLLLLLLQVQVQVQVLQLQLLLQQQLLLQEVLLDD